MPHLLLARHGETSANVERRFQGQRIDPPLTERGLEQAVALARFLRPLSIDAAYCSDARRARQTAETIGEGRQLSLVETPLLRELDFGAWEGLTRDEAQGDDPDRLRAWEQNPLTSAPPDGEDLAQLAGRVRSLTERLLRGHAEKTVLLVSHGGPLRVLLAAALGLAPAEYWRLRIEPGSLSELSWHPAGGVLTRLNFLPSPRDA